MHHINLGKIHDHIEKVNNDKVNMKQVVEVRHREEGDQRQYERDQKEIERERQQIYKDTLDHQMKLHELQRNKYGTMTHEEKRINRLDLLNYKGANGSQLEAMIPGIHNLNSVGTSPLKRGGRNMMNSSRLHSGGNE